MFCQRLTSELEVYLVNSIQTCLSVSGVITNSLGLAVVITDLVQEQFLDGVELLGPLEEDSRDADVPAQGQAHGRAQHGGQLE